LHVGRFQSITLSKSSIKSNGKAIQPESLHRGKRSAVIIDAALNG